MKCKPKGSRGPRCDTGGCLLAGIALVVSASGTLISIGVIVFLLLKGN